MENNRLLCILVCVFFTNSILLGQTFEKVKPLPAKRTTSTLAQKTAQSTPLGATVIIDSLERKKQWRRNLISFEKRHESENPEIEAIKASKVDRKLSTPPNIGNDQPNSKVIPPSVGTNFLGNELRLVTPPDNSMAISNGGIMVSTDNLTIEYYSDAPQYLSINTTWTDFFGNFPNLTSSFFDPKVIYDSAEDRFILVVLHGFTPATSFVMICFSVSNDPRDGWYIYQFPGNVLNDGSWFDYPNIGLSTEEFYVTGNLFSSNNSFNQAILYQIPKNAGYNGQFINWQYWNNIFDADGSPAFTLVPATYGQQGSYGPGIYLVSSQSGGNNRIHLYDLTGYISAPNEQILNYSMNVQPYSVVPAGFQLGSTDLIENNDCRVLDAFYLNGLVHFTLHSEFDNTGWNGLYYGRINANTITAQTTTFGLSNFDYSFPDFASFSNQATDHSVAFCFLRTNSTIYPEVRTVTCDNNFEWSNSSLVKAGETFVDIVGEVERWGDYASAAKRYNAPEPTVWLSGCFGQNNTFQNNSYSTWIAQVSPLTGLPVNLVDFTAEVVEQQVHLNWITSEEWNNDYFEVQRSKDGQNWDEVAQIKGNGTINTTQEYKTVDTDPYQGISYYRLKNVDFDGKAEHSKAISVELGKPITSKPTLAPNPIYDMFAVEFDIEREGAVNIFLSDASGKKVKTLFQDQLHVSKHRIEFNRNALAPGIYFLTILHDENVMFNEKVVIAN